MIEEKQRESGIEMLKILAMFLIVISHVTQTLGYENLHYSTDYVYRYQMASTNIQSLILAWISSFGAQGNLIFFACSAWFLIESTKINYKKIISIIMDVWIINIVILVILEVAGVYTISAKDVIKSIFPTLFANNWYITCYILFYLIHVVLNRIIRNLTQKEFLTISVVGLVLYFGFGYIDNEFFFASSLILFIVVYFAIAYMKLYMKTICKSKKVNVILLIIGIIGTPIMILLTNFLGYRFLYLQDKLTLWSCNASPFLLMTAIALFNLLSMKKFFDGVVNRIASLSMLIYIVHENLLVRTYIRPQIWIYIYNRFGYSNVILWVLLQAVLIFLTTIIISYLYRISIQRITFKLAGRLSGMFANVYEKAIVRIMQIK